MTPPPELTPASHRPPALDSPTPAAEARRLRVDRWIPASCTGALGERETTLFELLFVEEGFGSHRIGSQPLQAVPGDLFLIAPGKSRDLSGLTCATTWLVAFRPDVLGPARYHGDLYSLVCAELLLDGLVCSSRVACNAYPIPPSARPRLIARLSGLQRELRAGDLGYLVAARAILELLLIDVIRVMRPRLTRFPLPTRPMLVNVFRFIDYRFRAPIGLADVAKAVNRSPSYLTDLVHRETGRTVLQWIIERRMAEARRLLLASDDSVKTIGQHVGYDDSGHFIRLFHRVHGQTPHRWRSLTRSQLRRRPQ